MTVPQIVSLISTILLTSVALVVGIQLILVLRELRYSLSKVNQTLDTVSETVEKISQPAMGFFAILEGLKEGSRVFDSIAHIFGREKQKTVADTDAYDTSI